jgi:hypothetical protein
MYSSVLPPSKNRVVLGLIIDPEDGGIAFNRNVG